jgi:hypothetical protein
MAANYITTLDEARACDAERSIISLNMGVESALERLELSQAYDQLARLAAYWQTVRSEPSESLCEFAYWESTMRIAACEVLLGGAGQGHTLALLAMEGLEAARKRRSGLGLKVLGCESMKSKLAMVFAETKWRDRSLLASGPDVEFVYRIFESAAVMLATQLRVNRPEESDGINHYLLERCSIAIAKMLFADNPPSIWRAETLLDTIVQMRLSPLVRHFAQEPEGAENQWWYWDFEIAKMIMAGVGSLADFDCCNAERQRLHYRLHEPSTAILASWDIERKHFTRGLSVSASPAAGANSALCGEAQ